MKKVLSALFVMITCCYNTIVDKINAAKNGIDISAPGTWVVKNSKNKPKSDNEFDAIIVGSGIGGLTCAALLASKGYKVVVLEQHYQVGGYCTSYQRNGFTFPAGVEDVSGLCEFGPVTAVLNQLGLKKDDLFVRNTRTYSVNGKKIILTGEPGDAVKKLSASFPAEARAIERFFNEAQEAYEEMYSDTKVYGIPLVAEDLIRKLHGKSGYYTYPFTHPTFMKWHCKTYAQIIDKYFHDESLKEILTSLLGYLGTPAEKTIASSGLGACISYFMYGGYYPKGSAQHFAEALKKTIEDRGGLVLVNHKVDEIIVDDNQVSGVRVGTKVFKSKIVVANANAKTTFCSLITKGSLPEKYLAAIKKLKMSQSAVVLNIGLDIPLKGYSSHFPEFVPSVHVVINSVADEALAPQGKASVTMIRFENYQECPVEGTTEYIQYKENIKEELLQDLERIIPDVHDHVIFTDVITPRTFERYTSMPEGALYAFYTPLGSKRPHFKTPIKGLYLASSSTLIGGGIEAVMIMGATVAHDINGWKVQDDYV